MVFKTGAQFQQLIHCKFRESIVRTLYIPSLPEPSASTSSTSRNSHVLLIVNKYGKVGLYTADSLILLHTFLLDLSIPMLSPLDSDKAKGKLKLKIPGYPKILPKCQNTHLVVDAVFAPDCQCVIYLTTKGILQLYDIGEIESEQPYAVDLVPRKEFRSNLKAGASPPLALGFIKNKGHVETHRIYGLPYFSTCMEYYGGTATTTAEGNQSFLLIGNSDGCITIICMRNAKAPFEMRKIRGLRHDIKVDDLIVTRSLEVYKAHSEPVTALQFIPDRKLVISTSLDKKYSMVVKDLTDSVEPYVASIPKGTNTLAHSDNLKLIVTGGDDCILRFFNSLVPTLPCAEVEGHKCPIVALEFLTIPFANHPMLLSFSKDLELLVWNPTNFHCLQRLYITFPPRSMTHLCKTPEFAKHSIYMHQPKHPESEDLFILILYCNSFAKLTIENETETSTSWPFDFNSLKHEFNQIESHLKQKERQRKLEKATKQSQNPKKISYLTSEEIESIESKMEFYMNDVISMKRQIEQKLGKVLATENETPKNSISAQVIKKMSEFKNADNKKLLEHGYAFSLLPTFNVEKLKFPSGLPITESMKNYGISEINNPEELIENPQVKSYFESKNLSKTLMEYKIAEKSFPNIIQECSDLEESESSENESELSADSIELSHSHHRQNLIETLEKVFELKP